MATTIGCTSPAPYKLHLRGGSRRSSSKGVYFDSSTRGRPGHYHAEWRAEIYHQNKRIRLGRFATEEEAARAYESACIRLGKRLPATTITRHLT